MRSRLTHRRRSTALLATLAVTSLVLTACGRDDSGGEAEEQSEEISGGEATGTIEVWAMGTEGEVLQDFSADFEEANPDVDVKVTAVPWESAHDKLAGAIASGETPDVSLIGTTWMGEFAEAGGLMPTRRAWSTRPTSSPAPGSPPRWAARRTASRGTSRPASSTTARTWPRRPAGTRPRRPGTS